MAGQKHDGPSPKPMAQSAMRSRARPGPAASGIPRPCAATHCSSRRGPIFGVTGESIKLHVTQAAILSNPSDLEAMPKPGSLARLLDPAVTGAATRLSADGWAGLQDRAPAGHRDERPSMTKRDAIIELGTVKLDYTPDGRIVGLPDTFSGAAHVPVHRRRRDRPRRDRVPADPELHRTPAWRLVPTKTRVFVDVIAEAIRRLASRLSCSSSFTRIRRRLAPVIPLNVRGVCTKPRRPGARPRR